MSLIMDNRLESNEKDEEVKKLQELVKKLESQNEELRSERVALLKVAEAKSEINDHDPKDEKITKTLDNIETIGLEQLNLSDDENWLYDSPRTKPHSKEWLRKDVDDPALTYVKKSLVHKLDYIANSPNQSPRHSYCPSPSSAAVSPESPTSKEIDTRTFVRQKRNRKSNGEGYNDENRNSLVLRQEATMSYLNNSLSNNGSTMSSGSRTGSRDYLGRSTGSLGSEDDDRLSSASEGSSYSSYRLADVEDVNTVARLQEESLKLPDCSPGSRLPAPTQASPRHYSRSSGLQTPKRYGAPRPAEGSREGSDLSTPPDSPYTSHSNLQAYNGSQMNSRLPGITRRLGGSDPRLLEHNYTPSSSRGGSPARREYSPAASLPDVRYQGGRHSRLQQPQASNSRLGAPSPVRVSAMAVSPIQPKTSIPRPGSKLQPPRSRIAKPSSSTPPIDMDDWREGCY